MSGTAVVSCGGVLTEDGPMLADVICTDGLISAVVPAGTASAHVDLPAAATLDASGRWVVPGFVDLQVNGASGVDLTTSPHRVHDVGSALVRHGVTAYLPTVVSSGAAARAAVLAGEIDLRPPAGAAVPLGWHFEGPMLDPAHRGAHDAASLRTPSEALVAGWRPESGVRLVTIAPELDGALEVVRLLAARGVVVAAGHTGASAAQLAAAQEAGARYATHLFNTMGPLHHRDPGVVGAVLGGDLVAGLIVDGVHVDPLVVTIAWRCLGPARTSLVSDAVAALDAPAGGSSLGGRRVAPAEGAVRDDDGRLAGSVLGLDQAVRNLVAFTGCAWRDAVATVTSVPSRLLGDGQRGVIRSGARADLVLLDDDLSVRVTIVGGEVAYLEG